MKTITIKAYTAKELQKKNPSGFERAHEDYNNDMQDILWTDEIMESLKELFKHCNGVTLKDWNIGVCSYSYIRIEFSQDEVEDLTGPRAMAWLENNLLSDLRIPFTGKERWDLAKYGRYYRPNMIKPCPFTGYCFDDTLLESLQKDIKRGDTLKEAFENLAEVTRKEFEGELENQQSVEYFLDSAMANEWLFKIDGEML